MNFQRNPIEGGVDSHFEFSGPFEDLEHDHFAVEEEGLIAKEHLKERDDPREHKADCLADYSDKNRFKKWVELRIYCNSDASEKKSKRSKSNGYQMSALQKT